MRTRKQREAARSTKGRWIPTRRRRALARKRRKKRLQVLAVCLLLPLAAFGISRALQSDGGPVLPDELAPEAFAPHAQFRTTARVGTMFKATLIRPPLDSAPEDFEQDMRAVAARAGAAGYDTIVVTSPDGTTLASGPVDAPTVQLPDHEGS